MEVILIDYNDLTQDTKDELNFRFNSPDGSPIENINLNKNKFGYLFSVKKYNKWQQ